MRFEELAQATERDRDIQGGDLCFTGTRVPVTHLLEHLEEGGTVSDFLVGYPTVDDDDAELVAGAWRELRRDARDPEEASDRLIRLSDWLWTVGRLTRQIARGELRITERPRPADLRPLFPEKKGPRGDDEPEQEGRSPGGFADSEGLGLEERAQGDPPDEQVRIEEALHLLTDASSALWNSADGLQDLRPVHAQHLRELRSRIDAVAADLESGPGDP